MKICFAAAEAHPFAKTGGLADVSSALVRYLHRSGHDVKLFLPLYGRIDRKALGVVPVEAVRDVRVRMGEREIRFSGYMAPLPGSGASIHLVECPVFFGRPEIYSGEADEPLRFAFFSRAVIEWCQRIGFAPEIFHCNDWHTALVPLYLRSVYGWDALFGATRTVLTIHNLGYQGMFPAEVVPLIGLSEHAASLHGDDLRAGRINFLKTGILHAHSITTVSPTYAREIQTAEYGFGLNQLLRARAGSLVGILNGVDGEEWNPATDPLIPHRYTADRLEEKERNKEALLGAVGLRYEPGTPCLGIVSRLTAQKGFELLFDTIPPLLRAGAVTLVSLGAGEERYEGFLEKLQSAFPGRACFYRGHNHPLAHRIEAGADLFLMPSRYEPCGLNQMYSLRYGTVPVVRRTGGLADTVEPIDSGSGEGTGFLFDHFTSAGFRWALDSGLALYRDAPAFMRLRRNGMARDFSWERQGAEYERLYRRLIGA